MVDNLRTIYNGDIEIFKLCVKSDIEWENKRAHRQQRGFRQLYCALDFELAEDKTHKEYVLFERKIPPKAKLQTIA